MNTTSQFESDRIRQLASETARRKRESLRLFRAMPTQLPFFSTKASINLLRGGKRSGKSISAAVWFASAATGQPIHGPHGKELPPVLPTDRPLTLWIIGYDQKHIGQTIYRLLFRSGLFKIIKDKKTGEWRAFDPVKDKNRVKEAKPAPPLIPKRFIDENGWAWESKPDRVFTVCRLQKRDPSWEQGTEIYAFSSKGDPKQGDPVDGIWIDEDIRFPEHVSEWEDRLSDRKGRLIWSAFPHSKNDALVNMSARADEQKDRFKPDVFETVLAFSDNPFIDDDEKRKRLEGMSDDEIRARDKGEFLTDSVLVYPSFSQDMHGIGCGMMSNEFDEYLKSNGYLPPHDWTNFIGIDPGHSVAAALFASIPPPEFGDYVYIWNEVYARKVHANVFAAMVRHEAQGRPFEAFIMDLHASRQTPMGFAGTTVGRQYSEAFRQQGLVSANTDSSFFPGSDNVPARLEVVRGMLAIRNDGTSRLRFFMDNLKNTCKEFRMYKKVVTRDEVTDRPINAWNHSMAALEYICSYPGLKYVPPDDTKPVVVSPGMAAFLKWKGEEKKTSVVYCGAGVPSESSFSYC